jgi:hypothetical protein
MRAGDEDQPLRLVWMIALESRQELDPVMSRSMTAQSTRS